MTTESNTQTSRRTTRRNAALGVGAGLLAGGAVGLMIGLPGLSSAAGDDAPAAIVAEQDADWSTDEAGRPDPGARLRELLQELVDDGTINADQADAVAEHLAEHRAERGDRGPGDRGPRGPRRGSDPAIVADLLGVDAETLREQLRGGSSIADVAAANGVDIQTVIDALVAEAQEHLDLAVEKGRLTETEVAERRAGLEQRITDMVNGVRPERPPMGDVEG